jgi:hypothetical protein
MREPDEMWLIAKYQATTLFSLKPAWATSSGGKTLLTPTPYAIKMALLDVACRIDGVEQAEGIWPWLQSLPIALKPTTDVVVNNTFTRILKPRRNPAQPGTQHAGPFGRTIGYREYAYLGGELGIAFFLGSDENASSLIRLVTGINYLGKRGGFIQLVESPTTVDDLPDEFIAVDGSLPESIPFPSIMQQLDDCGESLTFEKVNIYTKKRVKLHKDRVLHQVVLPYEVISTSRGYTHYRLTDADRGE